MARPDRIPVSDALDVMPHPVAVDQACAAASVIAIMRPSTCSGTPEIMNFGGSPRRWPVLPDHVVIAADAAGGDDHRLRAQRNRRSPCARLLPRSTLSGSSTEPLTPSTAPFVIMSVSTRWRKPER